MPKSYGEREWIGGLASASENNWDIQWGFVVQWLRHLRPWVRIPANPRLFSLVKRHNNHGNRRIEDLIRSNETSESLISRDEREEQRTVG